MPFVLDNSVVTQDQQLKAAAIAAGVKIL